MKNLLKRLWQEDEGQDLTEYALLLALIALGAIATMGKLGNAINSAFGNATNSLSSAVATS
jgi:pilus assembly protein Flp/PilA